MIFIIILGIVIYLAIGGLLSGLFEFMALDDYAWVVAWPFVIAVCLVIFVSQLVIQPFAKLGSLIADRVRKIRKKNDEGE